MALELISSILHDITFEHTQWSEILKVAQGTLRWLKPPWMTWKEIKLSRLKVS